MNPAAMMKIVSAKNQFEKTHPKFGAYIKAMFSRPIEEGTILEVSIIRPGEEPVTSNIRVQQSDLELLSSLKELIK